MENEDTDEQVNQDQGTSAPVRTRRKYKLTKKLVRPKIRPLFQSVELDNFFDLIEKYKDYVLNQSGTVRARKTKNLAWEMLAKEYNNLGFKYYRSTKALHHKWRVLTCVARKTVRNTEDLNTFRDDKQFNRLVGLVSEGMNIKNEAPFLTLDNDSIPENSGSMKDRTYLVTENKDFLAETTDYVPENTDFLSENPDCVPEASDLVSENIISNQEEEKSLLKTALNSNSDNSKDDKGNKAKNKTHCHFSQEECRVLLQCISNVKEALTNDNTSLLNKVYARKTAWHRVAKEFNSRCNRDISVELLRGKFSYLKGMAKYGTSKCLIGLEPFFPLLNTPGCSVFEAHVVIPKPDLCPADYLISMDVNNLNFDDLCDYSYAKASEGRSDYGIPIKIPAALSRDLENNEVSRLKVELLKRQAENAKLEHQKMHRLMEDQALLSSLKLRAARLEAEARELNLPPLQPSTVIDYEDSE